MRAKFKNDAKKRLNGPGEVIVELGPGLNRKYINSISIDILDLDTVDIVADINKGLPFIGDNSVDKIYSAHLLEHVNNLEYLMREIYRVLKKGGHFVGSVPYFSNPYYYSDYTHKQPFGLYSFCYFSKKKYFRRNIPQFYNDIDFSIIKLSLHFGSPLVELKLFKLLFGGFINSCKYLLELYEACFCYLVPASEILFRLEK